MRHDVYKVEKVGINIEQDKRGLENRGEGYIFHISYKYAMQLQRAAGATAPQLKIRNLTIERKES
jgi:hypothetical protein